MNSKNKIIFVILAVLPSIFLFTYCDLTDEENIYIDDPLPYPYRASVTSINETTLKVEWYDVLTYCNDCKYQIERAVNDSTFQILQNQLSNNYYYDYDVDATKKYSYRIKAYNKEKSSYSQIIRVRYDFANELKKTIIFPQSWRIKLSHNKQLIAVTSKNIISILDARSWNIINTIQGQGNFVNDLHFSSDDSKIIFSIDSIINIVNIYNGLVEHSISLPRDCYEFAYNLDLSKILVYSFVSIPYHHNQFFDCYNYNGDLIWTKDSVDVCYDILYRPESDEFVTLTYKNIELLNPQDGSINYEFLFTNCGYSSTEFSTANKDLVTLCYLPAGRFILKIDLNTKERTDTRVRSGQVSNLKYVESENYYIYSDENMLSFHKESETWDYFTFAPILDGINTLEYSTLTGDIILTGYEGNIYVYSSNKSKQWFAYPYYGNNN